jgi:hypothetical protein
MTQDPSQQEVDMPDVLTLESRNILNYLHRHGYEANFDSGLIVVRDPVQVSGRGGARTEYKDVKLADWRGAIHFVEERS